MAEPNSPSELGLKKAPDVGRALDELEVDDIEAEFSQAFAKSFVKWCVRWIIGFVIIAVVVYYYPSWWWLYIAGGAVALCSLALQVVLYALIRRKAGAVRSVIGSVGDAEDTSQD